MVRVFWVFFFLGVGLAVSAVPLSTGVDGLASDKWFDESEVVVPEG